MITRLITTLAFSFLILTPNITFTQDNMAGPSNAKIANAKLLELYAKHFSSGKGYQLSTSTQLSAGADHIVVDNYIVQLGAFSKPNMDMINPLRQYGTLYYEEKGKLKVYKLGFYDSRTKAEEVQKAVKAKGFTDAIINAIKVRKKNEEIAQTQPAAAEPVATTVGPTLPEIFKSTIKNDFSLIQQELITNARYRVIKIINLLNIPLTHQEKLRMAASRENFYPEKYTLSKVYDYKTVANISFYSKLNEMRFALPNMQANFVDLNTYPEKYPDKIGNQIQKQIIELNKMLQTNGSKGLKLNQLLNKALEIDRLASQL